ncbi:hypothetical protein T484DRAFT_3153984 [Baffinella frigidus]|nr:hypothetical protein T484DRAFT_3153984 [Cryptophyta sp. CCMP2293]
MKPKPRRLTEAEVEERLDELAYLEDCIWKEERNTAKNEKEVATYLKGALEEIDDDLRAFRSRLRAKQVSPSPRGCS